MPMRTPRLTPRMKQAIRACAAGAVWQPFRDEGRAWQVDQTLHQEVIPMRLYNVEVSTHKALEQRGFVEVLEGTRECPYHKVFRPWAAHVRVRLLRLTSKGRKALRQNP